jgi:hypothetical protein
MELLIVVDEISRAFDSGKPLAKSTPKVREKEASMLLINRFFNIGKWSDSQLVKYLPVFVFKKR